ncbi:hypothetical protein Rsub_05421 [Raphidocelis subcapitata]|uniref:F-box domain-containing protein n=1 Tax=Raphidocelis subcapitata TaxID=307507 RepID=A0A2V0P1J9_9CHLO|nr:hypothetical protein Rsub_05421 [Raphidocelis subcapitata]|eukprot:GBF92802.1 hypothetical protein Rsub_05421 [Raphidocelis subcapitata]
MPPTTTEEAKDCIGAFDVAAVPHDLWPLVFAFLPPGDVVLTVPRVSKVLAAAAAPHAADVRAGVAAMQDRALQAVPVKHKSFPVPLWALQEAWPQLTGEQRMLAATRAAFHGDLAALRWALPQLYSDDMLCCAAAAAGGQLEVLQWARAQQPPCPWDERTCWAAAEGGHLNVLQWARAQEPPCPWDAWTCFAAAKGDHLAVLQWARAQQPPCPWSVRACYALASLAATATATATAEWIHAQIRAQAALESIGF